MGKGRDWYLKLLRDVNWTKKKTEIYLRDKFSCRICGTTEGEFQVHHLWYRSGKKPWEYANSELRTVCEKHHSFIHNEDYMKEIRDELIELEQNDYMVLFIYEAIKEKCVRVGKLLGE